MEGLKTSAQSLKTHVGEYVHTYVQLTKIKVAEGASGAASGAVVGVASFLFGIFFLFFLFFGVAYWLGSVIDSTAGGFFIVAGFFLLLIVVLFAIRKKVIVPAIRKTIINAMYDTKN